MAAIYYCLEMIKLRKTLHTNQSDEIMKFFLCLMTKINVLYVEIQDLQRSKQDLLPLEKPFSDILNVRITWNT